MHVVFPDRKVFSMDAERSIEGAMGLFDLLESREQKGEFFFAGKIVEEHPAECRKISQRHFCGGHGFEHENFSRLSFDKQKQLIEKTQEVFSGNGMKMRGWRFPRLQFNGASMAALAEKGIPDFSLSEQKLRAWGSAIWIWNFLKCAVTEGTLFFPKPFPHKLEEHPFSSVDLLEKNLSGCGGRVILHCYNFNNIKSQI